MCTYTFQEIDQLNQGQCNLPAIPKYQVLINFLERENARLRTAARQTDSRPWQRGRFNSTATTTTGDHRTMAPLFKLDTSIDGQIKHKIIELNSKITEHNLDNILREFKSLEFGQVQDVALIVHSLHRSLLICAKYGNQILELFKFLSIQYPNYITPLHLEFLKYSEKQLNALFTNVENAENLEERFMVRQNIMRNYDMIFKCFKMGIIFPEPLTTINEICSTLSNNEHVDSFETFVKFLVLQKTYGWPIPKDSVAELEKTMTVRKYPKRIGFLIMDLD